MEKQKVKIDYTNWKGERRFRVITPLCIRYELNRYHPKWQWILWAFDEEMKEEKIVKQFAMNKIHSWIAVE